MRIVHEKQKIKKNQYDWDDWSNKYDITLTILQQEYSHYIETIRSADEKANKYFVVISIFIAAGITVLTSSLLNELRFKFSCIDFITLLSICFIICLILCIGIGITAVTALIDSLEFVESRRMPDLELLLKKYGDSNSTQYKGVLIHDLQSSINIIEESIRAKQSKLRTASTKMRYCISLLSLCIGILFIIKIIGNQI